MLWYSLEASHQDASNVYHNICFRIEIKKNKKNSPFMLKKVFIWTYGTRTSNEYPQTFAQRKKLQHPLK